MASAADTRSASPRPAVALLVPFYGTADDGRDLVAALARVALRDGDEIVIADNTEDGRFPAGEAREPMRVVRAPLERSSYYARNMAVEASRAPWLLFVDSDTRPDAGVIDAYFAQPVPDDVGILSGGVVAAEGEEETLIARYARSRTHIDPEHYRKADRRPAGITANLLVRRAAWEDVHGFQEGVRSGGDIEFCWRVQDAGWRFDWRPAAIVEHVHVETVRALVKKTVRHAGGGGWVNERYDDAFPRPRLARPLARSAAGAAVWMLRGQRERGAFKAVDGLFVAADAYGRLTGNRAAGIELPAGGRVLLVERFPEPGDAVDAARVEARARPAHPDRARRRGTVVTYLEDDGTVARGRDLAWLASRRPAALRAATAALSGTGWTVAELAPAARRAIESGAEAIAGDGPAARALAQLAGRPFEVR
jgi:GT2 family glycosyltransferase